MKYLALMTLALTLAGCVHDSCRVPLPSHAYAKRRDCRRPEPASKLEPSLGYKGFTPPIPCAW